MHIYGEDGRLLAVLSCLETEALLLKKNNHIISKDNINKLMKYVCMVFVSNVNIDM